ncbi:MAG: hypothetical protein KI791_14745 [Cyclobacteriaceae bacterium]|nr:hypothetical protein [Cyclobacteriaceae bacterium SS2]
MIEFGWQPIVLTVSPDYYEETLDWDLVDTVKEHVIVEHSRAFKAPGKLRIIGDIGLRSFPFIWKKAKEIIRKRQIDAVWIPVPNYYMMVMGRLLYLKFKIPYGIDYIDPWTDGIPGAGKIFTRAWISNKIARFLEPFALKEAAFISGVSSSYYQYVFQNRWVKTDLPNVGMPYGFDPDDEMQSKPAKLPWDTNKKTYLYAGAFLPKSLYFLEKLFEALKDLNDPQIQVVFLGTGPYPGESITSVAHRYGLHRNVIEVRDRFPFLNILYFLKKADFCLLLGSTEAHYTASKTFQMLLSGKPVFSILHVESSAAQFLKEVTADQFLVEWDEKMEDKKLLKNIKEVIRSIRNGETSWKPDLLKMENFSARSSANKLAEILDGTT